MGNIRASLAAMFSLGLAGVVLLTIVDPNFRPLLQLHHLALGWPVFSLPSFKERLERHHLPS